MSTSGMNNPATTASHWFTKNILIDHNCMKSLCILTALLFTAVASAQPIDTRRTIEVEGTSKILAEVDRVTWQIKIRAEAASLAEASKTLESVTSTLRDQLKESGFADDVLRDSRISSGKHYEYVQENPSSPRETRVLKGYYTERYSVIEIADLSKRQTLESLLLADDHIEIVTIDLESSKHEELKKQALVLAVAAAKEKAALMAKEAGTDIGQLLNIREGSSSGGWTQLTENRIGQPIFNQKQGAEFEKLEYSSTVSVKFELQ